MKAWDAVREAINILSSNKFPIIAYPGEVITGYGTEFTDFLQYMAYLC
ncbi:hypothetical protein [Thermococcus sp.]